MNKPGDDWSQKNAHPQCNHNPTNNINNINNTAAFSPLANHQLPKSNLWKWPNNSFHHMLITQQLPSLRVTMHFPSTLLDHEVGSPPSFFPSHHPYPPTSQPTNSWKRTATPSALAIQQLILLLSHWKAKWIVSVLAGHHRNGNELISGELQLTNHNDFGDGAWLGACIYNLLIHHLLHPPFCPRFIKIKIVWFNAPCLWIWWFLDPQSGSMF
jgi:hypothetical protein